MATFSSYIFLALFIYRLVSPSKIIGTNEFQNHIVFSIYEGRLLNFFKATVDSSLYKCWLQCFVIPECTSFSWTPESDSFVCRLNKDSPIMSISTLDFADIALPSSCIGIRKVLLTSETSDDGFMYWLPMDEYNFAQAKSVCNSKPGFRLGIYKTNQQLQILQKFYKKARSGLWVDLHFISGSLVWGDGKNFDFNEFLSSDFAMDREPVFIFKDKFFEASGNKQRVLCQGIISDVEFGAGN